MLSHAHLHTAHTLHASHAPHATCTDDTRSHTQSHTHKRMHKRHSGALWRFKLVIFHVTVRDCRALWCYIPCYGPRLPWYGQPLVFLIIDSRLIDWLIEYRFYALLASKAVFRARTYSPIRITYSVWWRLLVDERNYMYNLPIDKWHGIFYNFMQWRI